MFTGIIEEVGTVFNLKPSADGAVLSVGTSELLCDAKLGDSIAVNGACLTIHSMTGKIFNSHVSSESLSKTTFRDLRKGDSVNLERALKVGDRLGGHFVSGHIDGVGEITNIESSQGWVFHIKLPERLLKYIIFKGSVAVNGVSLTVADLSGASFRVSVVPHSLEHTTLKTLKRGDSVNVECDMLGKYVESMVRPEARTEQSTVTKEFLGKHGFF